MSGRAELARLGWPREVALFTDDVGDTKRLGPVLDRLRLDGSDVVFVGDTGHDRTCALEIGASVAFAGWDLRGSEVETGDIVLDVPSNLLDPFGD